jgi:hypothetical protein
MRKIKRTGSAAGFHFVNLYQCCPRKWYLRFLKGWSPKLLAKPLVLGSAFHEGKAAFYSGKGEEASIAVANQVLAESKEQMTDDNFEEVSFRVPHLLHYWITQVGALDLEQYTPVAIEKEYKVPILDTGFIMTIRPDTILKDKASGLIFIMETKTSGFSVRVTAEAVYYGDQATAYMMGVRKCTKLDPYAVQPDIAYWNKVTRNLDNMKFERPALVFRTQEQCDRFEKGIAQLFTEMSQKATAYKEGYDPWMLFPKNTHYCLSFSTPCDFAEICSQDCEKIKRTPSGFKKEGGLKLGSYILDTFAAD